MKETKTKKFKLPFWIQIVLIVLAGVIASGAILLSVQNRNVEKHKVTFAYSDGTVIEEKEVVDGKGVIPPVIENEGVFRGWSAAINNVENDYEVHPMIYDIVEDNLFYFNSPYVREGKRFTLDVFLGGKVNAKSGELTIEYDSDVLEYKKADCADDVKIEETEVGKLSLTFDKENALSEKCLMSTITFKAKKADAYSTELVLTAENVKSVENGKEAPAVFATINNEIYFLQEVCK